MDDHAQSYAWDYRYYRRLYGRFANRPYGRTETHRSFGRRIQNRSRKTHQRSIGDLRNTPGAKVWQRRRYEHIIRNDEELNRTRK